MDAAAAGGTPGRRALGAVVSPPPSTMPGSHDWGLMIRSLMVIWAVGGVVFLVLIAATSPPAEIERSLRGVALIGFTVLGMMIAGRSHLPSWTPDVCALIMSTIVGWIIVVYGDPTSPYSFVYLWLAVHSFYFLHWKRAAPQVAYIGATYALALSVLPGAFPITRWATTLVTTGVICSMMALLRSDVHVLVGRLSGLATTDALTGLRNRRAYDELVEIEVERSRRTGSPLTAVMGDLDHFKQVNDRLGHKAGDHVLRRVGEVLGRHTRSIDIAFRLGGEEFVLLLPNTDAVGGYLVAERMRQLLREEFAGEAVGVTMSFGVACFPEDAADAETMLAAADAALLTAKRAGRDRSVIYPPRIGMAR